MMILKNITDERQINKNLKANNEIEEFSKSVLCEEIFLKVSNVFDDLVSENLSKEKIAIDILLELIPNKPKRPLFYVREDMKLGRQMWTRTVITYLGAYLNKMLDFVCADIGGFKKFVSFGQTLSKLKGKINDDLYKNIDQYNKIFYRKAKHDFDEENYNGNDHLFSVKDAVYCCFVTMKLSEKLQVYLKKELDFSKIDMI